VVRQDGVADYLGPPFQPFVDTSRPGLYTVKTVQATSVCQPGADLAPPRGVSGAGSQSESFAVNFFPARPAHVPGPDTLHLGHVQAGKTITASVPVSIGWIFVLLALAILGLEWWVAFRGLRLK